MYPSGVGEEMKSFTQKQLQKMKQKIHNIALYQLQVDCYTKKGREHYFLSFDEDVKFCWILSVYSIDKDGNKKYNKIKEVSFKNLSAEMLKILKMGGKIYYKGYCGSQKEEVKDEDFKYLEALYRKNYPERQKEYLE